MSNARKVMLLLMALIGGSLLVMVLVVGGVCMVPYWQFQNAKQSYRRSVDELVARQANLDEVTAALTGRGASIQWECEVTFHGWYYPPRTIGRRTMVALSQRKYDLGLSTCQVGILLTFDDTSILRQASIKDYCIGL